MGELKSIRDRNAFAIVKMAQFYRYPSRLRFILIKLLILKDALVVKATKYTI